MLVAVYHIIVHYTHEVTGHVVSHVVLCESSTPLCLVLLLLWYIYWHFTLWDWDVLIYCRLWLELCFSLPLECLACSLLCCWISCVPWCSPPSVFRHHCWCSGRLRMMGFRYNIQWNSFLMDTLRSPLIKSIYPRNLSFFSTPEYLGLF